MTEAAPTTQAEQEDAVREAQADLRRLVNESNQTVFIRNFLRPVADRIDVYVDELRTERDQLAADLRKATVQISDLAQAKGEAEGRLRASEMAGVVEGWREQNERLAADLRKAREERDAAQAVAANRDAVCDAALASSDWAHLQTILAEDKLAALDTAMKRGIRAWSARLHVPVTRMMSRVLREEIHAALAALTPDPKDAGGTAKGEDHGA